MVTKEYYNELIELKEKGKLFSFEEITYQQLKKLWWEEKVNDRNIAHLFDVKQKAVSYKRSKMDIMQMVFIREEILKEF